VAVTSTQNGVRKSDWDARKREAAKQGHHIPERDDQSELTAEDYEKYKILRYCRKMLSAAQTSRKPYETYDRAWALFNGEWPDRRVNNPSRARITPNKIRAVVEFIAAIMTDQKPRFAIEPEVPGSEDAADLLRRLVDRFWDDEDMQAKVALWILYGLVFGYAFIKKTYDSYANGGRGKHNVEVIPPERIWLNDTATCIEDAEFIIHIEKITMGWIRRNFPDKAHVIDNLRGGGMIPRGEDGYPSDNIRRGQQTQPVVLSAMKTKQQIIMPQLRGQATDYEDDTDTVEMAEFWFTDQTREEYELQEVGRDGRLVFEPEIVDGIAQMKVVGSKTITSEIDGTQITALVREPKMVPVMVKRTRLKFPNGRLVQIAAGNVLLRDIPNPYQNDGFPFAVWKDKDVGGIYGQGEPLQLQSCAVAIMRIASHVYEILEKTSNPSWVVRRGGVDPRSVENRMGTVIPAENVTDIKMLEKGNVPPEFFELYKLLSAAISEMSGVNEAVQGQLPAANTAFATMDALQESGSAMIRGKVRNFESGLTRFGKITVQQMQQFDNGDRPLRIGADDLDFDVVAPASEVSVQFKKYTNLDIQGQIEFKVVPISSLSTSPAAVAAKWISFFKEGLVDKVWWHRHERLPGWKTELPRLMKQQEQDAAKLAALKSASKTTPKSPSRSLPQSKRGPSATP
jgi:hypothetical protein